MREALGARRAGALLWRFPTLDCGLGPHPIAFCKELPMNKIVVSLLAALTFSFSVQAAGPRAVRKTVEASMQVRGQVVIAADGSLQSYTLEKPEALPEEVKSLLARYLPACEFAVTTATGKPDVVTSNMTVQILARQNETGGATIAVNGTQFADPKTPEYIRKVAMPPPNYPISAMQAGLSGTVYLVLRLNPDGSVAEAHTEQVNMTVLGSDTVLRQGRVTLSKAALAKAREWRFEVLPARLAEEGPIDVRVPVDFKLGPIPKDQVAGPVYGKWEVYVPGPYASIPWRPEVSDSRALGALAGGSLYPVDSKIKLRKEPAGS
jgi:TonB family protein